MSADPYVGSYGSKPTPEEVRQAIDELTRAASPHITGSKKIPVRVVALRRVLSALCDQE